MPLLPQPGVGQPIRELAEAQVPGVSLGVPTVLVAGQFAGPEREQVHASWQLPSARCGVQSRIAEFVYLEDEKEEEDVMRGENAREGRTKEKTCSE